MTGITAIRLEALADPRLPGNGAGRAPNGNFVLNAFRVTAVSEGEQARARPVVLQSAWADFAQYQFPVSSVIHGNTPIGWAVHPEFGTSHLAVFGTKEPISLTGGALLTFTLDQRHRYLDWVHNIGRFRLSVTTRPALARLCSPPLSLIEGNMSAWTRLGAAHSLRKDWPAAVAALEKATALPSGGTGYDFLLLARAHGQLGRHTEARKCDDRAAAWLASNPADAPLAHLAWEVATERIGREPDNAALRLLRAQALVNLDFHRDAVVDFNRVLATRPDTVEALIGRARAYLALQEPDNAARDFTRALELRPNDPSVRIARAAHCERLIQRASAASRQNDHAGALRFPRQAARIDPAFAKAHNNLAWLLLTGPADLRNPAEALRHAYRAVELVPAQSTYHNTLGVALYRNGQLALAVPVLRKSLAGGKGQSDAFDLFFLAMCHARLGDRTKAKDCFDRAVTWSQKQKNLPREHQEELKAFRAEAEEVLRNVQPAK